MNVSLLSLFQGVGAVTLAVVAFAVALTWPALTPAIRGLRSERPRWLAFAGLGLALLLASAPLYLAPWMLLRDGSDPALAVMLAATWTIAVVALVIRGLLLPGFSRVITIALAVVAATGLIAGAIASEQSQHGLTDTAMPTGAFLLVVAAVAGIVFWSQTDERPLRVGHA